VVAVPEKPKVEPKDSVKGRQARDNLRRRQAGDSVGPSNPRRAPADSLKKKR
jgi:hypothetical protein